jgi:hypothetical protein
MKAQESVALFDHTTAGKHRRKAQPLRLIEQSKNVVKLLPLATLVQWPECLVPSGM